MFLLQIPEPVTPGTQSAPLSPFMQRVISMPPPYSGPFSSATENARSTSAARNAVNAASRSSLGFRIVQRSPIGLVIDLGLDIFRNFSR